MSYWAYVETRDGKKYYSEEAILGDTELTLFNAKTMDNQPVGDITIPQENIKKFYMKIKPFREGER